MTIQILNFLHQHGYRKFLAMLSQRVYNMKGYKHTTVSYHPEFRAYEFVVEGITFLSIGPGWAYSRRYLEQLLHETYCHAYWPQAGDCVVDIGAGLGEEGVIYALLVGSGGRVHAVEANPVTFGGLKYLFARNNFSWANPHNLAIYHTDGQVTIEDDHDNYLINTIQDQSNAKNGLTVKATTLDSLVRKNGIQRIDFLKSNIEGAEQFLIEGMKDSVGLIRNLCISCHDFRHQYHNHGTFYLTKEKVKTFLQDHGFEITIRNTGNRVIDDYVYARRK